MTEPAAPDEKATAASERFLGLTLVVGLIAAVVVLMLLSWLASEMLEGETMRFDAAVRAAVHGFASPAMTALMRGASRFGAPAILAPIGVVISVIFYRRGWKRAAVRLPLIMLGAGLLDELLKISFRRPRPVPFFDYPLPGSYSFPSGHAMFGFCFFVGLAALVSPRVRSTGVRATFWAVAVFAGLLIGLSRVYLGVHYPSDVVAGWGSGFVWVMMVALGDRVAHRMQHRTAA